jgi:hypothetical protein
MCYCTILLVACVFTVGNSGNPQETYTQPICHIGDWLDAQPTWQANKAFSFGIIFISCTSSRPKHVSSYWIKIIDANLQLLDQNMCVSVDAK